MIKKRSFKAQYDLFNDSEIDMIECKLRMMGCRVVHGGDRRTLGEQQHPPTKLVGTYIQWNKRMCTRARAHLSLLHPEYRSICAHWHE